MQRIDRAVQLLRDRSDSDLWRLASTSPRTNLFHIAVWILFFVAMAATGRTDGKHTGDSLPFWQQACADERRHACERLLSIEAVYCSDNSGWACSELGVHYTEGTIERPDSTLALAYFSRACELRFQAACVNLLDPGSMSRANPKALDLRLLLRERKRNLMEASESELYARACDHGWAFACDVVSLSPGVSE